MGGITKNYINRFLFKLNEHPAVKAIAKNSGWLMAEKVFQMTLGLFVGIWVARYLGPGDFGILSYGLTMRDLLGSIAYLGLSGIVIRDLVKSDHQDEIMGTAFVLRLSGAVVGYIALAIIAFSLHFGEDKVKLLVLLLVGTGLLFKPFQVIESWFHSRTEAKFIAPAKVIALGISALVKITALLLDFPLLFFAMITLLEVVLIAGALTVVYFIRRESVFKWKFRFAKAKELLSQSWLLLFSGFFATIYLKADIVMLEWLKGSDSAGIYTVAARLSEVWYFLPAAIATSVFPTLTALRNDDGERYKSRLSLTYKSLFIAALALAVPLTFLADFVVTLLYGVDYFRAGMVLSIHIWAGIFIFMRALTSKWMIIEGLLKFSFISQGAGAVVNIIMNVFLIPAYGEIGAAIATLVSYSVTSYFICFLYKPALPAAVMMTKAIFFPFVMGMQVFRR